MEDREREREREKDGKTNNVTNRQTNKRFKCCYCCSEFLKFFSLSLLLSLNQGKKHFLYVYLPHFTNKLIQFNWKIAKIDD